MTSQAFHAASGFATCKVSALVTLVKRGTVFAACDGMPEVLEIGIMDGLTRSSLKTGKRLEMTGFLIFPVESARLGGLSDVDG